MVVQPFGDGVGGSAGGPAQFGSRASGWGEAEDGVPGVGPDSGGGAEGGGFAGAGRSGDHGDGVTAQRRGPDGGGLVGIQPGLPDVLGDSVGTGHPVARLLAVLGSMEDSGLGGQ